MIHLLYRLSSPMLALTMLVLFVLGSWLLLWIFIRFLPFLRFRDGSEGVGQIFGGAIGTIFALIFALVIIAVWQNYDRVSYSVDAEANCLHNIYRSLESYPPEMREPVQAMLRDYVKEVLVVEWPLLADGRQDRQAHRKITAANFRINNYRPANQGEVPLHTQTLQLLSQYRSLRHDRIRGAEAYLDEAMWVSLMSGSFILLVFVNMVRMPDTRQHALMVGALGACLGLVFYLLLVYNHPFAGPGTLGSRPFARLLQEYWVLSGQGAG